MGRELRDMGTLNIISERDLKRTRRMQKRKVIELSIFI